MQCQLFWVLNLPIFLHLRLTCMHLQKIIIEFHLKSHADLIILEIPDRVMCTFRWLQVQLVCDQIAYQSTKLKKTHTHTPSLNNISHYLLKIRIEVLSIKSIWLPDIFYNEFNLFQKSKQYCNYDMESLAMHFLEKFVMYCFFGNLLFNKIKYVMK